MPGGKKHIFPNFLYSTFCPLAASGDHPGPPSDHLATPNCMGETYETLALCVALVWLGKKYSDFQGNALGYLRTSKKNCLCQNTQVSIQHGAEHTSAVRPCQWRRVPVAMGSHLLGQHAHAIHCGTNGQGQPDKDTLAQDTEEEPRRL